MDRKALSAHRRTARRQLDRISALVAQLLQERQELVAGWVRLNRRTCGNAENCRLCRSGGKHENLSFGTRYRGQYLHRGIRPEKLEWLQGATERWHAFHKGRSALAKECDALVHEIDRIKDGLTAPWQGAVRSAGPRRSKGSAKKKE